MCRSRRWASRGRWSWSTAERRAQAQDLAGKEVDEVDEEYKEEISVKMEDDLQLEQRKQDCL